MLSAKWLHNPIGCCITPRHLLRIVHGITLQKPYIDLHKWPVAVWYSARPIGCELGSVSWQLLGKRGSVLSLTLAELYSQ